MPAPRDPIAMQRPLAGPALTSAGAGGARAVLVWAAMLTMILALVGALALSRPTGGGPLVQNHLSDSLLPASAALTDRPRSGLSLPGFSHPGLSLGDDAVLPVPIPAPAVIRLAMAMPRAPTPALAPRRRACPGGGPRAPPPCPTMTT